MHPSHGQITESNAVQNPWPAELISSHMELDEAIEVQDNAQAPDDDGALEDPKGVFPVVVVPGLWVGVGAHGERQRAASNE